MNSSPGRSTPLRLLANSSTPADYTPVSPSTTSSNQYPACIIETISKIRLLDELDDNWDSYGGIKPTRKALMGAFDVVYGLFVERTPMPSVFPVSNGGIQIEWSQFNIELEIEIASENDISVYYHDLNTGEVSEYHVENNWEILGRLVNELTNRNNPQNFVRAAV